MSGLPEKYLKNMEDLLGEDLPAYLRCLQEKKLSGLRVNTLKTSVEEFRKISPFELSPVPWTKNGFYVSDETRPGKHPYYYAGLYYLQEPSAMLPAQLLPIEPGDRVLDLCAAPGGKSTELAARLNGTGTLYANDISASRAQALLKNIELFGVRNAVILSEDPERLKDRFEGFFDKILIDAPCSGEGMFRKDPAVIRSWIEHGNAFYVKLQKSITAAALKMLKPGGMLLYSTCTFSPLEDEDIVLHMLDLDPDLTIVDCSGFYEGFSGGMPEKAERPDPALRGCIRVFPHEVRGEGHFAALLQKRESGPDAAFKPQNEAFSAYRSGKTVPVPAEALEFLSAFREPFNEGLELRGDRLFYRPFREPDLTGLHVIRSGLLLGEVRKGRFEPSQALAMAVRKDSFDNVLDLREDDPRVLKYLRGETVFSEDHENVRDGWVLILVSGHPLGFAKSGKGVLKNKYLPGWRYQ